MVEFNNKFDFEDKSFLIEDTDFLIDNRFSNNVPYVLEVKDFSYSGKTARVHISKITGMSRVWCYMGRRALTYNHVKNSWWINFMNDPVVNNRIFIGENNYITFNEIQNLYIPLRFKGCDAVNIKEYENNQN
tara:strand:- start:745 stop:1140 length:396 start_codon:yes stop_codon:yes gene_type:complete